MHLLICNKQQILYDKKDILRRRNVAKNIAHKKTTTFKSDITMILFTINAYRLCNICSGGIKSTLFITYILCIKASRQGFTVIVRN